MTEKRKTFAVGDLVTLREEYGLGSNRGGKR